LPEQHAKQASPIDNVRLFGMRRLKMSITARRGSCVTPPKRNTPPWYRRCTRAIRSFMFTISLRCSIWLGEFALWINPNKNKS
jgi:hypothetical protein